MLVTPPRRRLLLYLIAVLLPSLFLLALALRGLAQERRSVQARRAERTAAAVRLLGRELEVRLARLGVEAIESTRGDASSLHLPRGVLAVLAIQDGQLVPPWAAPAPPATLDPANESRLLTAERLELVARDPRGAARLYREVLASVAEPGAIRVRLKLARALRDAGDFHDAWRESVLVLEAPLSTTDLTGTPLGLYAAMLLLASSDHRPVVASWLRALPARWDRLSPTALLLARRVADSLGTLIGPDRGSSLADLDRAIGRRLAIAERIHALQLGAGAGSALLSSPPGSWLAHGDDPVMIGPMPAGTSDSNDLMVSVISARVVVESLTGEGTLGQGLTARVNGSPGGDGWPLGPRLAGLHATIDVDVAGERSGLRLFYLAGLALILVMGGAGAWLLWRDVRREVRLADLRAGFVANVSHELRTPLTSIRLYAETLSQGTVVDDQERREYLDTIVTESERLTRLLNNVLDFGKIERGERRYHRQPESLSGIVRDTVRVVESALVRHGFTLVTSIADDLPAVAVDRDAIEQAILNLLSNAMKYSGERKEIQLRLRREDDHALIEVVDHGIGIPLEEQTRIFDRYYRVPAAPHAEVPGSGLGLTLVHHVVTAHGGRVTVRSAPEAGSTFTLCLPLEPAR